MFRQPSNLVTLVNTRSAPDIITEFNLLLLQCAKRYNINPVKVDECAHSYHGNQLQHQMAMLTYDLDPPMNFVPWITLNGVRWKPIDSLQWFFIRLHVTACLEHMRHVDRFGNQL